MKVIFVCPSTGCLSNEGYFCLLLWSENVWGHKQNISMPSSGRLSFAKITEGWWSRITITNARNPVSRRTPRRANEAVGSDVSMWNWCKIRTIRAVWKPNAIKVGLVFVCLDSNACLAKMTACCKKSKPRTKIHMYCSFKGIILLKACRIRWQKWACGAMSMSSTLEERSTAMIWVVWTWRPPPNQLKNHHRRRFGMCLDKSTGRTKQVALALQRLIVDMSRDQQDVQFYTGEYSAKKFEVSRNLLPELHAGVVRLEEEEAERADLEEPHVGNRERALSILRRLTFGMQRCVAKSNAEMAYQLLFQQEQLVTYTGYQMFFRFVAYAILRTRHEALQAIIDARPDLRAVALDVVDNDDPTGEDLVPILEIGSVEVLDKDVDDAAREDAEKHREQRVVSTNQKDDYLHRGSSALLSSMSMVMYARFVRRVPKSRVALPDYVNLFPFAEHYAHFSTSLQDLLRLSRCFVCFFFVKFLLPH